MIPKKKKFPYLYIYLAGCVFIGIYWSLLSAVTLAVLGLIFSLLKWLSDDHSNFNRFDDELFEWAENANFEVQVFRENKDKNTLNPTWMKLNKIYEAILYPEKESSNIIVFVKSIPVGYLNKDDARAFRRRLGSKKLTSFATKCKIKRIADHSLWLDIKPFNTKKDASSTHPSSRTVGLP